MTDFDASRDDELVSAYLDGEATPEERARVENDPRLQQRLREFRQVSAAVGTPHFFPDAPDRDALLARAVASSTIATPPDTGDGGGSGVAPVVDLAARRRRQAAIFLSAAAAVIVAVLAVPALLRSSSTDDVMTASNQLEDTARDEEGTANPAVNPEGGNGVESSGNNDGDTADSGSATTTAGAPSTPRTTLLNPSEFDGAPPVDLGTFATRADAQRTVSAAIDDALTTRASSPNASTEELSAGTEGQPCATTIEGADDEVVRLVYAATFALPDGRHEVLVYELTTQGAVNGTHRIYEVLLPGCQQVGVQTI
jgi:hypothetical protein